MEMKWYHQYYFSQTNTLLKLNLLKWCQLGKVQVDILSLRMCHNNMFTACRHCDHVLFGSKYRYIHLIYTSISKATCVFLFSGAQFEIEWK
jgi:hypothetical protein